MENLEKNKKSEIIENNDYNEKTNKLNISNNNILNSLPNLIDKRKIKLFDLIQERIGYGYYQYIILLVAGLCFMTQGFYFFLNSGMLIPIKKYFKVDNTSISVASSMIYLPGIFFTPMMGFLTNSIGRIRLVKITLVLTVILHVLMSLTSNFSFFCVCLVLIGACVNLNGPIITNILAEFLPVKYRAFTMGSIWGWYSLGNILLLIIYWIVMPEYSAEKYIKVMNILLLLPFINMLVGFFVLNNSPRALIIGGYEKEGLELLAKMYIKTQEYKDSKLINNENDYDNSISQSKSSLDNSMYEQKYEVFSDVEKQQIIHELRESYYNEHLQEEFKDNDNDKKNEYENNLQNDNASKNLENNKFDNKNYIIEESSPDIKVNNEDIKSRISNNLNNNDNNNNNTKNKINKNNAGFFDMFNKKYCITSMFLSLVWILNSLVGYGPFFILPITLTSLGVEENFKNSEIDIIKSQLFVSVFGIIANPLGGFLCELRYLGRLKTGLLSAFIGSIINIILIFDFKNVVAYMGLLGIFNTLVFNTTITYTSEVYPTYVRDYSSGFMNCLGNFGAMISQPIFVLLNYVGMKVPYMFCAAFFILSAICFFILPYETRGIELDCDEREEDKYKRSKNKEEKNVSSKHNNSDEIIIDINH